jgi:hypothetical protein
MEIKKIKQTKHDVVLQWRKKCSDLEKENDDYRIWLKDKNQEISKLEHFNYVIKESLMCEHDQLIAQITRCEARLRIFGVVYAQKVR